MRRAGSAGLCLLLAACAALEDLPFFSKGEAPGAPVATVPPETKPAGTPPAAPVEPVDPRRLVGLTRDQVMALIGPPASVADKAPATVWAYRTDGCSLEVMFYMDVNSRTFRALTYEVQSSAPGAELPASECVGRLRAARNVR